MPDVRKAVRAAEVARFRFAILAPALSYGEGTPARLQALKAICARQHLNPLSGRPEKYSLATLYAWLREVKKSGDDITALRPQIRQHAPRRTWVSVAWDQACPLPGEEKTRIARELCLYVQGLWRNDLAGARQVSRRASTWLLQACHAAGWPAATLDICKVKRSFVERPEMQAARDLGTKEKNNTEFFNNHVPRIRRHREDYMPWEVVCLDVHPMDILITRLDGSTATPKLIAWLDIATNFVHYDMMLFGPGNGGVTQVDVAASLAGLICKWGLPRKFQRDNGSENFMKELEQGLRVLEETLKGLAYQLLFDGDSTARASSFESGGAEVFTTAKPYSPTSKAIEGIFSCVEKFMRGIPGYIGGDRMNKLTHDKARQPLPYPGTWQDFAALFSSVMKDYHNTPQQGLGMSPAEKMQELHAKAAENQRLFRPAGVDMGSLVYAMAADITPMVTTHGIEAGGRMYWCDGMEAPGVMGRKVRARHARWAPDFVWVELLPGRGFLKAAIDPKFAYLDGRGAKEQARRAANQVAHYREISKTIPKVDPVADMHRHVASLPDPPAAMKGAQITAGGEAVRGGRPALTHKRPAPAIAGPLSTVNPQTGAVRRLVPNHLQQRRDEEAKKQAGIEEALRIDREKREAERQREAG